MQPSHPSQQNLPIYSLQQPIILFLLIHQPYYIAGEYLQGSININCLQRSFYHNMFLRLQCDEKVIWAEMNEKSTKINTNSIQTYNHTFLVHEFKEKQVKIGQYSFPFKFKLPDDFPGTLYQSKNKFIRYGLKAILLPSITGVKVLESNVIVNIIQPIYKKHKNNYIIGAKQSSTPKFCGCCFSSGQVNIMIKCDRNFVKPGMQVNLILQIDNTNNKKDIKQTIIKFSQKSIMIGNKDKLFLGHNNQHILYIHDQPIKSGSNQKFSVQCTIPHDFSQNSTSIGQIIGRYFSLDVIGSMGCFMQDAKCELHVIYHVDKPTFQFNTKLKNDKPEIWNPQVKEKYVNQNLLPYQYKPHDKISHLKRRKSLNMNIENNNINFQGTINKNQDSSLNKFQNMRRMSYNQDNKENSQNNFNQTRNQQSFNGLIHLKIKDQKEFNHQGNGME